ncbi:MAG: epoxyqueuosine reductase [Geobacteraceae bacterium]|nr:epoxyqueuosine reductase [Geobacteraceae bacterium]
MRQKLVDEIIRFVTETPANRLPDGSSPYFETPLVGFAAANDPQFGSYKKVIGEFHLTPQELFAGEFGLEGRAGTVVSWILPIAEHVRKSNRYQGDFPSREWAQTRNFGEGFNSEVRRHVVGWLQENGYRAAAPQLSPQWKEFAETPKGRSSTWSERHAAYAAGLGTFSLNDALITEKGIAHRCGSVVTDLVVAPSERQDRGYAWNCLYYREGSCGACIGRCPVGAISFSGHDKVKCCEYVYGAVPGAVAEKYGVKATGCGLCQTRVPCENWIPRGSGRGAEHG